MRDTLSDVVYTATALTANYTYAEASSLFGMYGSYKDKETGSIANCQVRTYGWDDLTTSFVVNGNLTFGAKAVFTGDITSEAEGAKITVTEGAKFTNSQDVTTADGNKVTAHKFAEGLGINAGSKIELLGKKMTLAHWQPSYAVGVDQTGNFIKSGDLDFGQIPTDEATYTYNGSTWN